MPDDINPTRKTAGFYPENARQTFGEFVINGWDLEVGCWSCRRRRNLTGAELVERYGADRAVGWLYAALKCDSCGGRHPQVWAVKTGAR